MRNDFLLILGRLASLLRPGHRQTSPGRQTEAAPLDPVERLQRSGSTFPVVMELPRLGW